LDWKEEKRPGGVSRLLSSEWGAIFGRQKNIVKKGYVAGEEKAGISGNSLFFYWLKSKFCYLCRPSIKKGVFGTIGYRE